MDHAFRFTSVKIRKRLDLVRAHRFRDQLEIPAFNFTRLDPNRGVLALYDPVGTGQETPSGSYWGGPDVHFHLQSAFELSADWQTPALHLPMGSMGDIFNHPEALVRIDGNMVGSADRYHHTLHLDDLKPGAHRLELTGWTGLAGWPPDPTAAEKLLMRPCYVVDLNPALEELLILAECALETAELSDTPEPLRSNILDALDATFVALDTRDPLGAALHASAPAALACLKERLDQAGQPMPAQIVGIGHAHMDVAYLWPVRESRHKNARTYSNVLRLMARHPEFHFAHSQPQLYEYAKRDFPEMFVKIKQRVSQGRWEPVGGMWVEPDANIPGAEALVRQILLGRSWFAQEFGDAETPILWLPDTFGFSWCLPQLMAQSGLEMLVTNKLSWNQHNRFPSSTSWWQGMDGTKVLFHLLTTPRDVQHLPFPTNYKSDLTAAEVHGTVARVAGPKLPALPICFGYGDGGGGPTDALIARAKAYANLPGQPRMRMGRAADVLAAAKAMQDGLPVWNDELYMEGHRGVLTGQGWIKRANRQAEAALHRAELLMVMAGQFQMPAELTVAWQKLCLNQFHDVLTGTAIGQVFKDSRRDYQVISDTCAAIETQALGTRGKNLVALNPAPTPRHSLGLLAQSAPVIPEGSVVQSTQDGVLVSLPMLEAYQSRAVGDAPQPMPLSASRVGENIHMENPQLRVVIGADGHIQALFDKINDRPILAEGSQGNQLWAFEDRPLAWDAWDIDPFFEDRAEQITDVTGLEITETGPLRATVTVTRRYRRSRIVQHIRLTDRANALEFATQIDWHEQHILLKCAFEASVSADRANYDIQWGQIARPTSRDTSQDASRFEVCAHKWAALHDGNYAVGLLNDCKYGHDILGSLMRLTLLKSSTMPDPQADQGAHEFSYAIMGQAGPGFEHIRNQAYALNHPVMVSNLLSAGAPIASVDVPNVLIETLKPSEDGNGYILRLFEAEGWPTACNLGFVTPPSAVFETNLLEKADQPCAPDTALEFKPFEIKTLRVVP